MWALILAWLSSFSWFVGYFNACLDAFLYWKYKRKLTHWTRAVVRIALFVLSSSVPFFWLKTDLVLFFSMLGYSGLLFYLIFEYLFNKWIKQDKDFIGTTAETDKLAWKILGKDAEDILPKIKLAACMVFLAFFIITYVIKYAILQK